jgi:hypothetical protein
MTGVVTGNVGSGKSDIGVTGNGMTRETIAVGLEVIGATTMKVAGREATGTTTMTMTAVGVTVDTNGTCGRGRRAGTPTTSFRTAHANGQVTAWLNA